VVDLRDQHHPGAGYAGCWACHSCWSPPTGCFSSRFWIHRRGGSPAFPAPVWFYSHPAVYIMILPAIGRRLGGRVYLFTQPVRASYRAIASPPSASRSFGFSDLGHHMFVPGYLCSTPASSDPVDATAIFSAIKVVTWTATLPAAGRSRSRRPCSIFLLVSVLVRLRRHEPRRRCRDLVSRRALA